MKQAHRDGLVYALFLLKYNLLGKRAPKMAAIAVETSCSKNVEAIQDICISSSSTIYQVAAKVRPLRQQEPLDRLSSTLSEFWAGPKKFSLKLHQKPQHQ